MPTRRGLLRATLCTSLCIAPAIRGLAGNDDWAAGLIRQVGADIAAIMAAPDSLATRKLRLESLLDRVVDVDGAARFCLGRFWRQASPQQQKDYVALFHDVLMRTVLARIGSEPEDRTGVQVTVGRPETQQDGVYVSTVVQRDGTPPLRVIWVVGMDAGNPRIIDVIAEGISLRITIRSDYASFLNRHDDKIDELLQALRQQACDGCAPAKSAAGQ